MEEAGFIPMNPISWDVSADDVGYIEEISPQPKKKKYPRKLKKGIKTFRCHPRTKWQRKAYAYVDKLLCAIVHDAIAISGLGKFLEGLEPGGIVMPPDQTRGNEIIVNRDQLQAFADKINEGCNGAITATIDEKDIKRGFNRVICRVDIK